MFEPTSHRFEETNEMRLNDNAADRGKMLQGSVGSLG